MKNNGKHDYINLQKAYTTILETESSELKFILIFFSFYMKKQFYKEKIDFSQHNYYNEIGFVLDLFKKYSIRRF